MNIKQNLKQEKRNNTSCTNYHDYYISDTRSSNNKCSI